MFNKLSERSYAQRIYVSPNSRASTPFFERGLKLEIYPENMLEYFGSVNHDICLVTIDFAGLTSRTSDIVQLIEKTHPLRQ
ncbi:MAG: hypothetical protein EXX96DRAFT_485709 [Benjaminiella poitrasii]|nr:MAG: hypothetical protein EXX96DRAFT_485709 [Benjaminiella poitrasii]